MNGVDRVVRWIARTTEERRHRPESARRLLVRIEEESRAYRPIPVLLNGRGDEVSHELERQTGQLKR